MLATAPAFRPDRHRREPDYRQLAGSLRGPVAAGQLGERQNLLATPELAAAPRALAKRGVRRPLRRRSRDFGRAPTALYD